ncbi:hypothetical protein [Leptolyngbya sp. 'hensonii']|uniref:hypothetical protein n=1 Tax=Leptolyngbya sp. 'hensonii' TaxID=1922337 RepID=UPI001C0D0A4E|nr:hypothetical protein [Leptolyngbya sp. 'hensonii']
MGLSLGMLPLLSGRALALPGQTADEVAAWIKGNPTLQGATGEVLVVRRSDTPARRYIFQASVLPPGRIRPTPNSEIIRTEQFSLFDMVNKVTTDRLEESLRILYGLDIYQDYNRARPVLTYPNPAALSQSVNQVRPLIAALQGELRVGERYAYWTEIAKSPKGYSYTGQITVLLKEDAGVLEAELRERRL